MSDTNTPVLTFGFSHHLHVWYRCKWSWSEAILQSLAVVSEVLKEMPFVEASNSEGRRTSWDKKREESPGFCSVNASLVSWMLRDACGSFRMEGELWTQLRHRQGGHEFCWRAEAIRDIRRLAGKHTLHSPGTAWYSLFYQFLWFVSSCCFELFQNVILQVAGPVSVMVEDGHSLCHTSFSSILIWIQVQHVLLQQCELPSLSVLPLAAWS